MVDLTAKRSVILCCELIAAAAMVVAIVLVPAATSTKTPFANDVKWPILGMCSLVAGIALAARWAAGGRLPPTIRTGARFLALFIAAGLLSTIFSRYPEAALRQTMWYGFWAILVLTTAVVFRGGRWSWVFVGAAMLSTMFVSVAGIMNVFGEDLYGQSWFKDQGTFYLGLNTRIFSTIGLETGVGGFGATFAILAFGCMFVFRNLTVRVLLGLIGVAAAACTYFSGTRSSELTFLVAAFVFAGLFVWTFHRNILRNRKRVAFLAAVIAVPVIALGVGIALAPDTSPLARFRNVFNDVGIRGKIWQTALISFVNGPVIGHGPGTGELLFPRYRPADYADYVGYANDYAHSEYLEVLGETGLLGFIAFALVILFPLVQAFRSLRNPAFTGNKRLILAAAMAAIVMLLHAAVNVDTRYADCQMVMWVMLGFVLGLVDTEEPAVATVSPGLMAVAGGCVVLAGFAWQTQIDRPQQARIDIRVAEEAVKAGDETDDWARKNKKYDQGAEAAQRALQNDRISLRAMKALIRAELRAGRNEEALRAAQRLQGYAPHYGYVDYYLGLAYSQLNQMDKARASFEDAQACDLWSLRKILTDMLALNDLDLRREAKRVIRTDPLE